jgi:hypothetical protein
MIKQQKLCANDKGRINEGNMTSLAKSEMEAPPPEENLTETDYNLGKGCKRRRNSEDLTGFPNRPPPKFPKPDNDTMNEDNNPDLILIN